MEDKKTLLSQFNAFANKLRSVSATDKMFFVQHLAVMVKAGIPISKAMETLSLQTSNGKFAEILLNIHSDLEKGETLSSALKKYEKIFGELFINMIQSGELSGKLEEVLNQLFIQLKKSHDLVSKIRNALIYPIIVVAAMFGIGIFMIIVVVPKITAVFSEMNAELPLATKTLIAISSAINNHGIITGVSTIISLAVIIKIFKTKRGKYVFDIAVLKLPIISPIIKKINIALFARTIGSLLKTEIPIVDSFRITSSIMKNSRYRAELLEVADDIKKGISIKSAMDSHKEIFPPVVLQMIAVGEETGALDDILDEVAIFYEEEVTGIMETLPSIIEPVLMLLLGLAVGFMAVAIIMPMYSLTTQF
ncbi:MAG: type II secretion system F family protein [bacterium]